MWIERNVLTKKITEICVDHITAHSFGKKLLNCGRRAAVETLVGTQRLKNSIFDDDVLADTEMPVHKTQNGKDSFVYYQQWPGKGLHEFIWQNFLGMKGVATKEAYAFDFERSPLLYINGYNSGIQSEGATDVVKPKRTAAFLGSEFNDCSWLFLPDQQRVKSKIEWAFVTQNTAPRVAHRAPENRLQLFPRDRRQRRTRHAFFVVVVGHVLSPFADSVLPASRYEV
jgi:hypothetical protein